MMRYFLIIMFFVISSCAPIPTAYHAPISHGEKTGISKCKGLSGPNDVIVFDLGHGSEMGIFAIRKQEIRIKIYIPNNVTIRFFGNSVIIVDKEKNTADNSMIQNPSFRTDSVVAPAYVNTEKEHQSHKQVMATLHGKTWTESGLLFSTLTRHREYILRAESKDKLLPSRFEVILPDFDVNGVPYKQIRVEFRTVVGFDVVLNC